MEFPEEAGGADEHLCDMLDALEARLTHLLRERDELREKLGCLFRQPDQTSERREEIPRFASIQNPFGEA